MRFRRVVLPEPKKPVRIVTGIKLMVHLTIKRKLTPDFNDPSDRPGKTGHWAQAKDRHVNAIYLVADYARIHWAVTRFTS